MFSKHRLEALSDGVFAIAMTLLILDIKAPADVPAGELGAALLRNSHEWVSFAITFFLAAVFWTLQHRVFDLVETVDGASVFLTFVTLIFLTVIPFTTSLWGHHLREPLAFLLYFANQFGLSASLTTKLERARMAGHLYAHADIRLLRVRLYVLTAAMGSGVVCAWLVGLRGLPIGWIFGPPLLVSGLGKAMRRRLERRWNGGARAADAPART